MLLKTHIKNMAWLQKQPQGEAVHTIASPTGRGNIAAHLKYCRQLQSLLPAGPTHAYAEVVASIRKLHA